MRTRSHSTVPNLVVAQRVLDQMAAAARHHLVDETGEAMVGLCLPPGSASSLPTLYVLDTIAPDESAVRQYMTFQQGDARQDELIWWLQENWQIGRSQRGGLLRRLAGPANRWDAPLRYLGDWHKQPGHMIQPSGGDLQTALAWLLDPDNESEFMLAPIVTLGHPAPVQSRSTSSNYVMLALNDSEAMRVDFWYIDRATPLFQPISPTVYPDDQLPALAPYPWHLLDETRYEAEMQLFRREGLFQALSFWEADDVPPLEICFLPGRVGADHLLLLITPHDYPRRPPQVRVAPFIPMGAGDDLYGVFETAFRRAEPLNVALDWSPAMYLADVVRAAEAQIQPATVRAAPAASATASPQPPGTDSAPEPRSKGETP